MQCKPRLPRCRALVPDDELLAAANSIQRASRLRPPTPSRRLHVLGAVERSNLVRHVGEAGQDVIVVQRASPEDAYQGCGSNQVHPHARPPGLRGRGVSRAACGAHVRILLTRRPPPRGAYRA